MAVTKEEILESVGNMSVLELSELIKDMEEKFGVSAQAAVAVAAPAAGGGEAEAEEEQTEFDVVLTSFGEKKVCRDQGRAGDHQSWTEGSERPG